MNDFPKFHGHYEFLRLLLPTFHMINNVELELHRFFCFDFLSPGKELSCPLCRRIANSVLPIPPTSSIIPYSPTKVSQDLDYFSHIPYIHHAISIYLNI